MGCLSQRGVARKRCARRSRVAADPVRARLAIDLLGRWDLSLRPSLQSCQSSPRRSIGASRGWREAASQGSHLLTRLRVRPKGRGRGQAGRWGGARPPAVHRGAARPCSLRRPRGAPPSHGQVLFSLPNEPADAARLRGRWSWVPRATGTQGWARLHAWRHAGMGCCSQALPGFWPQRSRTWRHPAKAHVTPLAAAQRCAMPCVRRRFSAKARRLVRRAPVVAMPRRRGVLPPL
jgi:hypothetical protein